MDPKAYGASCRLQKISWQKSLQYFCCNFGPNDDTKNTLTDLYQRDDKLRNELAIKRSEIEEANKETEQLKRRYAAASSECEQLKKEHELYMMKKGMKN